ncbi:hypothetical protein GCM10025864_10990 [Luteimicrobium album]|uniref:Uncharacterized protein n=2 Tax=Luteimicrobium album TaxID=1054550 RepID=A0ABQ6I0P0_9MICO|nr:hypothetical protein GCM10025864_10990 [Luteimicrobium album]
MLWLDVIGLLCEWAWRFPRPCGVARRQGPEAVVHAAFDFIELQLAARWFPRWYGYTLNVVDDCVEVLRPRRITAFVLDTVLTEAGWSENRAIPALPDRARSEIERLDRGLQRLPMSEHRAYKAREFQNAEVTVAAALRDAPSPSG